MNFTLFASLLPFAAVMSITPGPNNLMVAASGVNFGFNRTIPHMLGVTIGFPLLIAATGLGLGAIIMAHPLLQMAMKYGGCAYLLFTAYKLATARTVSELGTPLKPLRFIEAALFQWINPKAWVMAVSMMAIYANLGLDRNTQIALMSALLGGMGGVAVVIWTLFGAMIAERLQEPCALRVFNVTMAIGLVASLVPVLLH
jgi:threonine/homoserine/homoserine lactone efflux protein